MKISGYSDEGLPIEQIQARELAEITLNVTPNELRQIASFLLEAADEMHRMGASYSHLHLADRVSGFESSPHLTVLNSELPE